MPKKRAFVSDGPKFEPSIGNKNCRAQKDLRQPFVRRKSDLACDQHLCARCRSIDFQAIFAIDSKILNSDGLRVFDISVRPSMTQSDCPLCRIFASMIFLCNENVVRIQLGNTDGDFNCHLRAFTTERFWEMATKVERQRANKSIVISLCESRSVTDVSVFDKDNFLHRGVIQRASPAHSTLSITTSSRCLPSLQKFPQDRMRALLDDCQNFHKDCSRVNARFPQGARLIDCESKSIVPLTSKQKYLTLSYVWGTSLSQQKEKEAQIACDSRLLPRVIPQTVEDAIEITIALGFQYLWVDRYCIEQHHADDKAHQIKEMAYIYSWASATICALGPNDNAGISGASQQCENQFSAKVQGMTLAWTGREVKNILRHSAWTGRGWTLQKLVLSPRCLLITEEGVVMACYAGVFSEREAQNKPFDRVDSEFQREIVLLNGYGTLERFQSAKNRFTSLRSEYLRRRLGCNTDAMNAFRGILSQIEAPSYWEVVAFQDSPPEVGESELMRHKRTELAFLDGLCWATDRPELGTRRCLHEIPSWSWLTQTSNVIPFLELNWRFVSQALYSAKVHILHPDHGRVRLAEYFSRSGSRSIIPAESNLLELRSTMAHWEVLQHHGLYNYHKIYKSTAIRFTWTSNDRWASLLPESVGLISLDSRLSTPDATATDFETQMPKSGHALLIMTLSDDLLWLAIRQVGDDTFCRDGMIRWPLYAWKVRRPGLVPLEASLKTIRLC